MSELLSLKLNKHENILDGITLYEPIDERTLEKLINSTLLRTTFNNPLAKIHHTEKKQLEKYLYNYENGRVKVVYKKNCAYGRSNPVNSLALFSIRREIRQTLAKPTMTDFDIDNAHPTLLYQIFKHNKIECSKLKYYIENRDDCLLEVMEHYGVSRDEAKTLYIILLYGGGVKTWRAKIKENNIELYVKIKHIQNTKFTDELKAELKELSINIINNNEDLVSIIKEKKGDADYYINSSVMSLFLQELECRILEILFKYCCSKNYILNGNVSLCADGLMLMTENIKHIDNNIILNEFKQLIISETGFDLNFSVKEMKQDYIDKLDKSINFNLIYQPFSTGLICNYFKFLYYDKYLTVDDILYRFNGIYWVPEDKKNSSIHNFIDTVFIGELKKITAFEYTSMTEKIVKAEKEEKKELEKERKKIDDFNTNINMLRNHKQRVNFVNELTCKFVNNDIKFDDNPFLFAFNNKVYDLKTNQFVKPTSNMYIKTTCGYDYIDYYDKSKKDDLNKLIDTIFTIDSIKKYYMSILATGLYGEQIENLFIASGEGGNGKSLINSLMCNALGDYAYKLPSNVLLSDIKEGGNPQIANLDKKRFVLVQEPDGNKRINCSTMKELTGDKKLNTRMNYSNKCSIDLNLTLLMECNTKPKLQEINDAIIRRIRCIPFTSKFVDKEEYNITVDKTNLFIGNSYYKSNEFQEDYKQALIMILFDYWTELYKNKLVLPNLPEECTKMNSNYLAMSDDIYDWFINNYDLDTNLIKEGEAKGTPIYITVKDIHFHFTSSEIYNLLNKADRRNYNLSSFRNKIEKNIFLKQYFKDSKKIKIYIENDEVGKEGKIDYNTQQIIINWKLK